MRNVLEVMKSVTQWHLWRLEEGRKIPYQIDGLRKAKANDPDTWANYDEAVDALHGLGSEWGLAFTLGERGLFTGVDFDDAYDDNRQARPWAVRVFDTIRDRCYAEVSPSGNGFKAVILGQKPDGARCSRSMGDGKQAIEIYDHNRFWAFTGAEIVSSSTESNVFDVNSDVVEEAGLSKQVNKTPADLGFEPIPVIPSNRSSKFSHSETLEYRAKSYLDAIASKGVSEGGRNNTIFSASGHLHSMGISSERAFYLIRCLNAGFSSPLSDEEVSQAFRSAARNGVAREDKGENKTFVADATAAPKDADIDSVLLDPKFIQDVPERSEALYRADDASEQIPMDLMRCPGFISDAMDWVMARQQEVHAEMAFSAAIHLTSLALSRNWKDDSCFETTSNMYSVILAESGAGKDVPRKMIKRFLVEIERSDMEGPSVIDSGAGLASGLTKAPTMSMLLDECGEMFSSLASDRCPAHFKKVGTVLKTVYTSAGEKCVKLRALANNDAGQNDPVDYPHLHILATATPKQVLGTVSDNQIEDGLMGRFMIFFGNNDPEIRRGKMLPVPEAMKTWFCKWTNCGGNALTLDPEMSSEMNVPELSVMPRTANAEERLESHYENIGEKRREQHRAGSSLPEQAIWNRASEKTAKLAMIFAASRDSEVIELQDADRAIAVNNHLTRRVVKVYKNRIKSDYAEKRAAVLSTLSTAMTSEALVNRRNSSIDPRMRAMIIEDLLESREISVFRKTDKVYYCLGSSAS